VETVSRPPYVLESAKMARQRPLTVMFSPEKCSFYDFMRRNKHILPMGIDVIP